MQTTSGDAFRNLKHLKSLSLPGYEILEDLSSIQHLTLFSNRLVTIQSNRWNLKTLDLSDNHLLDVSFRLSSIEEVYTENLNGLIFEDRIKDRFVYIDLPQNFTKIKLPAASNDYYINVGKYSCNQSSNLKHVYIKNVQFYHIPKEGILQFKIVLGNQCLFLKTLSISELKFQPAFSRQDKIFSHV